MNKIVFLPIIALRPHEKISLNRARRLMDQLLDEKIIKKPLLVEKNTKIILDGHHRFYVLKKLGVKKVPCFLINYDQVEVLPRRRKFFGKDLKKIVIETVKKGELLPFKTTKHIVKLNYPKINYFLYAQAKSTRKKRKTF